MKKMILLIFLGFMMSQISFAEEVPYTALPAEVTALLASRAFDQAMLKASQAAGDEFEVRIVGYGVTNGWRGDGTKKPYVRLEKLRISFFPVSSYPLGEIKGKATWGADSGHEVTEASFIPVQQPEDNK